MSISQVAPGRTERQQLVGGGIAFLLAILCMVPTMTGAGSNLSRMVLGLLGIVLLATGALLIGTSEGKRV